MPGVNAVLKAWHVMVGRDLHIPWPPGSPAPAPAPVPYVTTMTMYGIAGPITTRFTTTVYTDGLAPAMIRGTDIGPLIPHVGPPSTTLPLEMLASGSKSYFGASSVQVKDQWGSPGNLACALLGFTNPNLNCGTPIPTPFGLVIAPTTHLETLTLGDVVAGVYMMAWDFAVQALLNQVGDWLGKGVGVLARKMGVGAMSRTAARQLARAQGVRSNIGPTARAIRDVARARPDRLAAKVTAAYTPVSYVVGSPLGLSVSNVRDGDGNEVFPSPYERATGNNALNVEGNGDALGAAVDNYFNSPAAEEVPASSAADAGVGDASGNSGVAQEAGAGGAPETSSGPSDAGAPAGAAQGGAGPADAASDSPASAGSAPDGPNMSTADDAPDMSATTGEPNASMAPDGPSSPAPSAGPNASTSETGEEPAGSDGSPEAPFSSSSGDGKPRRGP